MIKAKVNYTVEHFKAAKIEPFSLKQKIIWSILAVLSICMAVVYASDGNTFNCFTLLAAVLWFFIILYTTYYHVLWSPKRIMKKINKPQPNVPMLIEFNENGVKKTYEFPDSDGYIECSFNDIDAAYEKNGFFVLYSKKIGINPIKNSEITEGTPDELRELLKTRLGNRFHARKEGTS